MTAPQVDRHPPVVLEPRSVGLPVAATALGISLTKAKEEVAAGRLRSFMYGARRLVPVDALDEWVRAAQS